MPKPVVSDGMEDFVLEDEETEQAGQAQEERGRSTIQFPYMDLDDAVDIAVGVHTAGGNSCPIENLAAELNFEKTDAPKFRQKLVTSKMFGLISYGQGTVALTALGKSICDPQQTKAARAEAFLKVPLYYAVYEQFKGNNLPPMAGLETAMETLGVAPKQKRNARLAFQRSANQAGYFGYGPNRLVKPSTNGIATGIQESTTSQKSPDSVVEKNANGGGGNGDGGGPLHPLIDGLIRSLPKAGDIWPIEKRAKWLRAASQNFDLIYPDTGDDSIEVKIQRGSPQ
jgi:hypothetical protein